MARGRRRRPGTDAIRRAGGQRKYQEAMYCKRDDTSVVEELVDHHDILEKENLASLMSAPDVRRIMLLNEDLDIDYPYIAEKEFGLRIRYHVNDFVIFNMILKIITKQLYAVFAFVRHKHGHTPDPQQILHKVKNDMVLDLAGETKKFVSCSHPIVQAKK